MHKITTLFLLIIATSTQAQNVLTPEQLWKFGRVSGTGISKDGKYVVYSVSTPNVADNKSVRKIYVVPVGGGNAVAVGNADSLLVDSKLSPDVKYRISSEEIKVKNITGSDFYPELTKSNVMIFDQLNYRHWDEYEDGKFGHIMLTPVGGGAAKDIMASEPYDCPLKPDGGDEDLCGATMVKKLYMLPRKNLVRRMP